MNNVITGFVFAKGMGDKQLEPDKRRHLSYSEVVSQFYGDTVTGGTIPSVSLPRKILETAYFFFQKKGFEKTTIPDICNRLDIKQSQFYNHFDSLDEVLEILWAS
ncbi:MAG: TetR/AcrR family transcriptional regulator [Desulforhopalus sp.]